MRAWLRRGEPFAFASAFALLAGARASAATIAIYPLQPLGVAPATVTSLDATLRAEVEGLPGIELLSRGRTVASLKNDPGSLGLACNGAPGCLTDLGKLLAVEKVVYGVVSGLGDRYSFDLKLIDVGTGGEERRVTASVGGKREVLLSSLRAAAVHLLAPERYVGALEIDSSVPGAQVYVDGKAMGPTPIAGTIVGLSPERHSLRLTKLGFADFEKFVDVRFDQTTVVRVDLAESAVRDVMYREGALPAPVSRQGTPVVIVAEAGSPRNPKRIWAWRAVYATVALAAVGLGTGLVSQVERNAASGTARPITASQEPTLSTQISLGNAFGATADVAWGLAGAGLIAAGVLFAISGGDAGSKSSVVISPTGAGLAVTGRFVRREELRTKRNLRGLLPHRRAHPRGLPPGLTPTSVGSRSPAPSPRKARTASPARLAHDPF